jgi:hypothetical protein
MAVKRVLILLTLLAVAVPIAAQRKNPPTFDVRGPMVVAFFPPVTQAERQRDPDTNEALSDFQEYAHRVREPLRRKGIEFHEVYTGHFGIRRGKTVTTFTPGKVQVGYYFVAPGKKPRIEYGVNTDDGLLQIADEYFGLKKDETPQ